MKTNHDQKHINQLIRQNINNYHFPKSIPEKDNGSPNLKISELVSENIRLKKRLIIEKQNTELILKRHHKMLSLIAHDLRSPYSGIIAVLDLIKEKDLPINVLNNYHETIYNSTKCSLKLLDNLLDWAIMDEGEERFKPEKIYIHPIVMRSIDNVKSEAVLMKIKINSLIPHDLTVMADANMLETIFRNLITNAVQYNNYGGEVIISAHKSNKSIEITISDTGPGIDENFLRELTSTQQQTHETKEERYKGLGLAFCKEFIERHNGRLAIRQRPAGGTEVVFSIPLG